MRIALYMHVSTDEQALEGYSLPEQLRDLRRYAKEKGWQIVAEEIDDGYPGRTLRRPALKRVQALADAGEIDAVVAKSGTEWREKRSTRTYSWRDGGPWGRGYFAGWTGQQDPHGTLL